MFGRQQPRRIKMHIIAHGLNNNRVKELERENLDLKITNRGKDFLIEQMQKERNGFFDQLLTANRKVGELETQLLQLEPRNPDAR